MDPYNYLYYPLLFLDRSNKVILLKYEKNQYSEGVSICSLIIAGGFLWWGFSWLFNPPWNLVFWIGFIWLGIGLSIIINQIYRIANRGKLRTAVQYEIEQKPNATIEQIAISLGITEKDARAIILDLKGRGQLRGAFSPTTGQMEHVSIQKPTPAARVPPTLEIAKTDAKYCPSCGTAVKHVDAAYCEFCGSKL